MATVSKPNTFTSSTVISPSEVNSNFDTIYTEFNGNISAANLATSAVSTAKIADSAVTTAKINDLAVTTAKIADANVTSEKLNATIAFRGTTTQAITNSASPTDITTYTEVFDLGADFSHTTGKFTCPLTGVYHFSVSGGFQDNASADTRMGIFIENRTTTTELCGQYARTGATNHDPIISTSVTTLCTAGDEIIAKMYQDTGTESLVSPSSFSGFFVGV